MSTRRSGLGRGLDALIPASLQPTSPFALIPVSEVSPNPLQPRSRFDDDTLAELAESIAEVGVLQPVAVYRENEGYVLIAGERRWRAARRAGLAEIPAVIRTVDDRGALTEALVENLQREDLTPLEEAAAYQQLLEDFGLTHEEIGTRVGKSRSTITNIIRLLSLPASIQGMLERRELSAGHAKALLGIEDRKFAEHVAAQAVEEGWSVRQVEDAAKARRGDGANPSKPRLRELRPVEIIELEQRLVEQLGTKVKISYRNHKGRVEISFASLDDLERLYRRFFA